ncbi:type II secretion system minor pseudopilin GspK [Rhizorhapis suberifaciens]|uniref:Type II secretion system protein K n=1 Tax=Rhizorhapis suberifaciens TaxID=13656 RepID=A0A840HSR0_9SPHN|nr:type II secretion system minor pseudopilin GspK [Rhizorhapis suberifaciens]MBB4641035.1 general secretion pathway protein K [Rhizorhapis suberifaciens]
MTQRPATTDRRNEQGAALLTVLLLVAIMSVIAATALERLTIATKLAGNSSALDQARAYAFAAETISIVRIEDLIERDRARTTLEGDWQGRTNRLPLPGGIATARVVDGGNCFNLNSLVTGQNVEDLKVRPLGVRQFTALMEVLGIPPREAAGIAASAADWIDSDSQPGGAEDNVYASLPQFYRTPNRMLLDASELRALAGVTPQIYATLRPWICALPTSDLSPINVNTLLPEQAPLFAMLLPGQLTIETARQMLAQRPPAGYGSLDAFWKLPAVAKLTPNAEVTAQTKLTSRFFRLDILVELGDAELTEQALIDAGEQPARLVIRQWGEAG